MKFFEKYVDAKLELYKTQTMKYRANKLFWYTGVSVITLVVLVNWVCSFIDSLKGQNTGIDTLLYVVVFILCLIILSLYGSDVWLLVKSFSSYDAPKVEFATETVCDWVSDGTSSRVSPRFNFSTKERRMTKYKGHAKKVADRY